MDTFTVEVLKSLFRYDPGTGHFYRLVAKTKRCRVGEIAGRRKPGEYVNIKVCGRMFKAHRLAWLYMTGNWPNDEIDHINGVRSDNAWSNLREATHRQNMCNIKFQRIKRSELPHGVVLHHDGIRFQSQIRVNGYAKYLGLFDTAEAAHDAWMKMARETRGEFVAHQLRGQHG